MATLHSETKPEVKQQPGKLTKEQLAKKIAYLRDKDKEMVRGKFHYHEVPGGVMSFTYKYWPGEQPANYTLYDGEIYTLPLGVAKHLNKNVAYPQYGHLDAGEIGVQTGLPTSLYGVSGKNMKITQMVRRCSFQSLEFVDIEDLSPAGSAIIQAEIV